MAAKRRRARPETAAEAPGPRTTPRPSPPAEVRAYELPPCEGYGLWLPVALALLAAGAMFAAFPPADLGGLAWLGLPLFYFALSQCRKPSWGALTGLVYGTAFSGALMSYLGRFGVLPLALVALFEGLFFAAMGFLAAAVNRLARPGLRAVGLAALWVIFEYLRSHRGGVSLSLGDVYYTQWHELPILQLASIGGGHLISFFMALLAASLATTAAAWLPLPLYRPAGMGVGYAREAARALLIVYAVFFGAFFWGSWAYRSGQRAMDAAPEERGLRVAYVQAAIEAHVPTRADDVPRLAEAYFRLSEALPPGEKLMVWPETAIPDVYETSPGYRGRIAALARKRNAYILAGMNRQAPEGRLYNTLLLFDPKGQVVDQYSKVHLVLYGEYVPWRERMPWLKRYPIRPFDYAPGEGFRVMEAGGARFAPLICFEALFSDYARDLCRMGAEFLVFATSDAWAEGSYEVAQHSRTAVLRAVEARRYVVRVASNGESAVLSPFGDRLSPMGIGQPGGQTETVSPIPELSAYHRWGDGPLLIFCCLAWLAASWAAPRQKPAASA